MWPTAETKVLPLPLHPILKRLFMQNKWTKDRVMHPYTNQIKTTELMYIIGQILKIYVIDSVVSVVKLFINNLTPRSQNWLDTYLRGKSPLRYPSEKWPPSWIFTWLVRQIFFILKRVVSERSILCSLYRTLRYVFKYKVCY